MSADNPHLILPCETRYREFEAKLLLACHAAEQGWRVTVGSMKTIDRCAGRLPRGIYVSKSVTKKKKLMFRLLPRLGHVVTAWDEEGLVYASPDVYRATKVGSEVLNLPVRRFAWGEANAQAWREHPSYAGGAISITGNPRADLLRPELRGYFAEEAAQLRQRYGDFILINTNFSRLNHFIPRESWQRRLVEDGGDPIASQDDPRPGLAAHKEALFRHFLEMVPAVARRFPDRAVVLRPHPSESPDIWRQVLADCPNAHVIYEGNVGPWLMAGTLVHNGCTTAVESFLLDRPAIAYQPVVSKAYDHPLPNALSAQCFSLQELLERLADTLSAGAEAREELIAARRDLARHHIASYDGPTAYQRVLEELDDVRVAHGGYRPGVVKRMTGWAGVEARRVVTRTASSLPHHRNGPTYLRHMFPPIDKAEVTASVRRFGQLLDRFDGLRIEDLGGSVFALSRD